jgi:hypothetical protein
MHYSVRTTMLSIMFGGLLWLIGIAVKSGERLELTLRLSLNLSVLDVAKTWRVATGLSTTW